jgi:hypothetical protein
MRPDSETSLSEIKSASSGTRHPIHRLWTLRLAFGYAVAVVNVCLWIAVPLLSFSHPLSRWDVELYLLACLLAFFFVFLSAFFEIRYRWNEVAIFVAIGAVVLLPYYRLGFLLEAPGGALVTAGFRIHASPIEEYRSRCELIEFLENGVKQTVGRCEAHGQNGNLFFYTVIYDTTGELLKPVSYRTQAWQTAMSAFYSDKVLNSSEQRTLHLVDDFYLVWTTLED